MGFALLSDRKVIAATGTAERLEAANHTVSQIIIQAETDNTGLVAIGGPNVDITATSQEGIQLYAGEIAPPLFDIDLYHVWLDAAVNGDGVTYSYEA